MSSPCSVMYCLVVYQDVADELLHVGGVGPEPRHPVDDVRARWKRSMSFLTTMSKGVVVRPLFFVAAHVQVVVVGPAVRQAVDQPGVAVIGEDDRLVGGEQVVELLRRISPSGCSSRGCRVMRSTTLTTRIFRSGRCFRRKSTAASVSKVGTSPAQAMTTSGLPPGRCWPTPTYRCPRVQCLIADSMSNHCGSGCLPETMTLTRLRLRRHLSATNSRELASGGR